MPTVAGLVHTQRSGLRLQPPLSAMHRNRYELAPPFNTKPPYAIGPRPSETRSYESVTIGIAGRVACLSVNSIIISVITGNSNWIHEHDCHCASGARLFYPI
jgi:hypothetical protein